MLAITKAIATSTAVIKNGTMMHSSSSTAADLLAHLLFSAAWLRRMLSTMLSISAIVRIVN